MSTLERRQSGMKHRQSLEKHPGPVAGAKAKEERLEGARQRVFAAYLVRKGWSDHEIAEAIKEQYYSPKLTSCEIKEWREAGMHT